MLRARDLLEELREKRSRIDAAVRALEGTQWNGPAGVPARQLQPAAVLGLRHKHGTKMRYLSGCRCASCRRGNAEYQRRLAENARIYGPNDLVSSKRVLAHLLYLQKFQIGHKMVAKVAGVGKTGLSEILWSGKQHIRRRAEARILALTPETLPHKGCIPAGETIERIHQLTRWGYTKTLITRDGLGTADGGLQLHSLKGKTCQVLGRTAVNVRRFFELIVAMRRVWEENVGPIPARHYVYWKPFRRGRGRPATRPRIDRLELRPVALTYDWNYSYPSELKDAMAARNELKRQVRRKGQNGEKQDVRSPGPFVRDSGGAEGYREAA